MRVVFKPCLNLCIEWHLCRGKKYIITYVFLLQKEKKNSLNSLSKKYTSNKTAGYATDQNRLTRTVSNSPVLMFAILSKLVSFIQFLQN